VAQERKVTKGLEPEWWRLLSPYCGRDSLAHVGTLVFGGLRRGRYGLLGSCVVCPGHVTHDVDFGVVRQAKMVAYHQRAVPSVLTRQRSDNVRGGDARCPK